MALRTRGSIFLLSLLLAAGCDRGDHPRQIGKPAPDFTIYDNGRSLQLSSYRGKVVLLNFWASWCAPCIEEIPALNQLQRQMPQLVVVGVDVDQDPAACPGATAAVLGGHAGAHRTRARKLPGPGRLRGPTAPAPGRSAVVVGGGTPRVLTDGVVSLARGR